MKIADVVDTTRLIRPGEVNGHAYHFVTREEFERDIEQDRFLEYRDVRGHFYGTAFSSIKQIMESGRVPVLDLHPQVYREGGVLFVGIWSYDAMWNYVGFRGLYKYVELLGL